jgi:hypothetical protein
MESVTARHWCLSATMMAFLIAGCGRRGMTAGSATPAASPARDSIQLINDRFVAEVLTRIAGREKVPAESVFRNVRLPNLRSIPAEQFLGIMNGGYARALGVTCTHCHFPTNYANDRKRPKRAAREMAAMHFGINQQLARMENLDTQPVEDRYINCATCHRGMVNPRGPASR